MLEETGLLWHASSAVISSWYLETMWNWWILKEHRPLLLKKNMKRYMWTLRKHSPTGLRNSETSRAVSIQKSRNSDRLQTQIQQQNQVSCPSNNPFHCQIKGTMKTMETGGTFPCILGTREDYCCLQENQGPDHKHGQLLLQMLVIKGWRNLS